MFLFPGAALVTIERSMDGVSWAPVGAAVADRDGQKLRLRSIYDDAAARDYATGLLQSSWSLAPETRIATALRDWSKPLREAIKVTLKRVGNMVRQSYVKAKLRVWTEGRLLRTYGVWKGSSYLESYWFCSDVAAARRLLKARVGCWGDEASIRHAPRGVLPRIAREDRACYLCEEAVWMPETLEHLIVTQHPRDGGAVSTGSNQSCTLNSGRFFAHDLIVCMA